MKARRTLLAAFLAIALRAPGALADPYRLRADAYYSAGDATAGLIMLHGEARAPAFLGAEAVVWMGTGSQPGSVLIASAYAREPGGRGELRAGRMMITTGAIRPIHLDGIDLVARAPWGTSVEVFGGVPVAFADGPRDFDWVVGQRTAQRIGKEATVGISYLHLRQGGAVAYEELGVDASVTPARWIDGAFSGAFDLARTGLTDARVSLGARLGPTRLELFALRRAPSHLLPATSLFAALGDIPSDRLGGSILWRAAPRLDVTGEGVVESLAGELGGQFFLRALLRLDDRGDGALGFEVRRQGAPDASWTGLRGTARVPVHRLVTAATEIEIVVPDDARGRGAVWPWALVALRLRPEPLWELAGAVEASASPTHVADVGAIFRVTRLLGGR